MKNKKITASDLELGQLAFGNPVSEYKCPEFVDALLSYIFEEIERVYWNKNQKSWDQLGDPGIPGIKYREYYWGTNKKEAIKPNFEYDKIEVRWYKHSQRGTTLNVSMTEKQWVKWFDNCLDVIRKQDKT